MVASYSVKIDQSRDTFLAVLGHDLRGPLAALNNCVQLQATSINAPTRAKRVLHIAKRSISSMEEMITDLLEYTRTRLGRGLDVSPQAETSVRCARKCWKRPALRIRGAASTTRALTNSPRFSTRRAFIRCWSTC